MYELHQHIYMSQHLYQCIYMYTPTTYLTYIYTHPCITTHRHIHVHTTICLPTPHTWVPINHIHMHTSQYLYTHILYHCMCTSYINLQKHICTAQHLTYTNTLPYCHIQTYTCIHHTQALLFIRDDYAPCTYAPKPRANNMYSSICHVHICHNPTSPPRKNNCHLIMTPRRETMSYSLQFPFAWLVAHMLRFQMAEPEDRQVCW